jgi:hypothetical protein
MNNPDYISVSLETIFWVRILKFLNADPGFVMEKKIRIRDGKNSDPDKHHRSAPLLLIIRCVLYNEQSKAPLNIKSI